MEKQDKLQQRKNGFIIKYLKQKLIIGALIVLAIAVCSIWINNFHPFGDKTSNINKTTKIGFEDIGELATQTAYCTEINVTEASRELFGIEIPFTQSKYIYSYDVEIKAGFNFSEIEWKIKNNTIYVSLPDTRILNSDVKLDTFKVYHENQSIFRKITLSENNEAMKTLKQNAEENAIANGLLKNARSNAETILTGFFSTPKYKDYKIEFTDK